MLRLLGQQNLSSRGRERASDQEVQKIQREEFVGEQELQRWSASHLKEELRRLQRQAEMRMGFAGGSETRASWQCEVLGAFWNLTRNCNICSSPASR